VLAMGPALIGRAPKRCYLLGGGTSMGLSYGFSTEGCARIISGDFNRVGGGWGGGGGGGGGVLGAVSTICWCEAGTQRAPSRFRKPHGLNNGTGQRVVARRGKARPKNAGGHLKERQGVDLGGWPGGSARSFRNLKSFTGGKPVGFSLGNYGMFVALLGHPGPYQRLYFQARMQNRISCGFLQVVSVVFASVRPTLARAYFV